MIQCFPFNLQGLSELSQTFGEADGVGIVGVKILKFTLKGSVVLLLSCPVNCISMNSVCNEELFNTRPIRASSHRWVSAGLERPRVNGTPAPLGGQKLRKGAVEIIGDEWGNSFLLAVRNDEEVAGPGGIPVVAPTRARKGTRLGTFGYWSSVLLICGCVHPHDIKLLAALIEN